MPRQKEFDEAEVLRNALEVFRTRGFKHTSFSNLTMELGVSRQSLYDTYGDKQSLYETALNRYLDETIATIESGLSAPGPLRKVLTGLFEELVTCSCAKGSGCLMVNSMIEEAPHDPHVRKLAEKHSRALRGLLAARIARAQAEGEVSPDKDPEALGRYLYHTLLGLSVAARALGDREGLSETVRLAVDRVC